MSEAEAIAILENYSSGLRILLSDSHSEEIEICARHYTDQIEAAELGIAALRAQEQNEPLNAIGEFHDGDVHVGCGIFKRGTTVWVCPRCNGLTTPTHKYCQECGQALKFDFSEIKGLAREPKHAPDERSEGK